MKIEYPEHELVTIERAVADERSSKIPTMALAALARVKVGAICDTCGRKSATTAVRNRDGSYRVACAGCKTTAPWRPSLAFRERAFHASEAARRR